MPDKANLLQLFVVVTSFLSTEGIRCGGANYDLTVKHEMQTILSPGYPENYESNDECSWTLQAPFGESLMLQLTAVDFQVNDLNEKEGECENDYLDIFEGNGVLTKVDRWCGTERKVIKIQNQYVTLHFKSNEMLTSKGFAILFSYVEPVIAECHANAADGDVIVVDNTPLYESFRVPADMARCEWRVESKDKDKLIVLELFKPSDISCKDGKYIFFEGTTFGHVNFEYCSTVKPFSKMYLRESSFTLTFESFTGSGGTDMILKISTRSMKGGCTDTGSMMEEVLDDPVVFSLPHGFSTSGQSCPVTLLPAHPHKTLRLDVMGTEKEEATCYSHSDMVEVKGLTSDEPIKKECANRPMGIFAPVYRQENPEALIVRPKTQMVTFLRASSIPIECNGKIQQRTAYPDIILKETIPSDGKYTNLAHCKYHIDANFGKVVLTLHWKPSMKEYMSKSVGGDSITIYDGGHSDKVLFSTNNNAQFATGQDVNVTVTSTEPSVLVVLDADAKLEGLSAHISYYSIRDECIGVEEIHISRKPQMVTSHNYPQPLPMNQMCVHHLVSKNPDDEIVVEIVEANLPIHCQNSLTIIEGKHKEAGSNQILGRVCGKDKQKFATRENDVTLVTWSGDKAGPGGWKVKAYTRDKSSAIASYTLREHGGGDKNGGGKVCHNTWMFALMVLFLYVFNSL